MEWTKVYKLPDGWIKKVVSRNVSETSKRGSRKDTYVWPPNERTILRSNNDILKYVEKHPDVAIDPGLVNCYQGVKSTDGETRLTLKKTLKLIAAVHELRAIKGPCEVKDPSPYEVQGYEFPKAREKPTPKRSKRVSPKCDDVAPIRIGEDAPKSLDKVARRRRSVAPVRLSEVGPTSSDKVGRKRHSVASTCHAEVAAKIRPEISIEPVQDHAVAPERDVSIEPVQEHVDAPKSLDEVAPTRSGASIHPVKAHVLEVNEVPTRLSLPVKVISPRDAADLTRLLIKQKSFPTPEFISGVSIKKGISYMTLLNWVQLKWPKKPMPEIIIVEDSSPIACPLSHLNVVVEPES